MKKQTHFKLQPAKGGLFSATGNQLHNLAATINAFHEYGQY
jgi:hypothetical protein